MLLIIFVFLGLVSGILIGLGLGMWCMKDEIVSYEDDVATLTRLNEQYRKATSDYITELQVRIKELEEQKQ